MSTMEQIILTTFTDPMMGLSYECEPVYEQLADLYKGHITFKYVMSGLVRDVSDFMLPEELVLPPEDGIRAYNKRLAGIYLSEETIGGLPMNMEGFHLFDATHRSSYPLCVAYKAAQLADPEKADNYLYRLRRATIVESRQTTLDDELISIAAEAGINVDLFQQNYTDGSALVAFKNDLEITRSMNIRGLPACLIQCGKRSALVSGMIGLHGFITVINKLC